MPAQPGDTGHLQETACEGALPSFAAPQPVVSCPLSCPLSLSLHADAADGADFPLIEQVEEAAAPMLTVEEGTHKARSLGSFMEQINHDNLVTIADTVKNLADAKQPRLSGKASLRLLAWVVAELRCASMVMEKPLAETVGKRLAKQAQKVKDDRAAIAARADHAQRRKSRHRVRSGQDGRLLKRRLMAPLPPTASA